MEVTQLTLSQVLDIVKATITEQIHVIFFTEMIGDNKDQRADTVAQPYIKTILFLINDLHFLNFSSQKDLERLWLKLREDEEVLTSLLEGSSEFYAHYSSTQGIYTSPGTKKEENSWAALCRVLSTAISCNHATPPEVGRKANTVVQLTDEVFRQRAIPADDWYSYFYANPWLTYCYLIHLTRFTVRDITALISVNSVRK